MRRHLKVSLASAAALLPVAASAQASGEATVYSSGHFKGSSMSFSGPRQQIDPPFTARSVRIAGGSAWEFCNGSTYSGCRRVDQSAEATVMTIRSARPVAPVIVARVSAPNQSLRGVASEFFIAPNRGGQRVGVPGNSPEGMRNAADDFCRSAGWRQSAHARLQSDRGNYYLIDVLCVNDGG
jgi:hypothetical protein